MGTLAFMAVAAPFQLTRALVAAACVILLTAALGWSADAPPAEGNPPAQPPGAALFARKDVHQFRIQISEASLASLRQDPRRDVRAQVRCGRTLYPNVALHLKGRTGSFRPVDDKPGLTLDFDQFDRSQTLHGLTKVHLDNSVEDPAVLNEILGAELFQQAGIPVPRVAHARVELNRRDLGVYVLREGYTSQFLSLHFKHSDGNLYEPVVSPDNPQGRWRRAQGHEPTQPIEDLDAMLREPDLARRWERLQGLVDLERFITFLALEVLLCHRDGYGLAANNYRVYQDPGTARLVFLPHGMDQLFGRADLPLFSSMSGPVARALLEIPEGRRRYQERAGSLFTNLLQPESVLRVVRGHDLSRNQMTRMAPAEARAIRLGIDSLQSRITNRLAFLARHLQKPQPAPLRFTNGVARLDEWRPMDRPAGGALDRQLSPDHRPSFHIRAGPVTAASWRTTQRLEAGRYRFEGRARTAGVRPLPRSRNQGAGLRITGVPSRPHDLTGHSDWTGLSVEFEVPSQGHEHEFLCELRASHGDAWFEADSLRVRRIGSGDPGQP